MRYMCTVIGRENQGQPPQALMDGIAKLGMEAAQAGVFVQMGGLFPSAMGTRIRQEKGKLTTIDGPYAEAKEVVGGFAIYETKTKEECVEWARRFMQLHLDHWPEWEGECEVRPMYPENEGPTPRP